jgi:hypothetical protein
MQLRRETHGRPKRARRQLSWTVHCRTGGEGISHRPGWKDGLTGWGVHVSDAAVESGLWPQEAVAASITKVVQNRLRHEWKPPVPAGGAAST